MMQASIETTLEVLASSLLEVKRRINPLFAQERAALNAACLWTGCLATSVVKPDGCARRQRAILDLGGSKRFWAVTGGMPMRCGI